MKILVDDPQSEILRLKEELGKTRQELENAKRIIRAKEIELNAILAQADEVSHTDALTYLPNRRQVINHLQKEVHRAERYKTPVSISIIENGIDVGQKANLTVSIGVAEYRHGEENWQKFFSRADMALYAAKNAGRNRWAVSD